MEAAVKLKVPYFTCLALVRSDVDLFLATAGFSFSRGTDYGKYIRGDTVSWHH